MWPAAANRRGDGPLVACRYQRKFQPLNSSPGGACRRRRDRMIGSIAVPYLRPKAGSVRLPAQECRNVELILLAVVMHSCLPSVLVQPLRRRTLGIIGDRFRPRLRPRHGRPGGRSAAGCGAAGALRGLGGGSSASCSRRPRPTAANRCSRVIRRFSGCSSARARRAGRESRSAPEPAAHRSAACAARAAAVVPAAAE